MKRVLFFIMSLLTFCLLNVQQLDAAPNITTNEIRQAQIKAALLRRRRQMAYGQSRTSTHPRTQFKASTTRAPQKRVQRRVQQPRRQIRPTRRSQARRSRTRATKRYQPMAYSQPAIRPSTTAVTPTPPAPFAPQTPPSIPTPTPTLAPKPAPTVVREMPSIDIKTPSKTLYPKFFEPVTKQPSVTIEEIKTSEPITPPIVSSPTAPAAPTLAPKPAPTVVRETPSIDIETPSTTLYPKFFEPDTKQPSVTIEEIKTSEPITPPIVSSPIAPAAPTPVAQPAHTPKEPTKEEGFFARLRTRLFGGPSEPAAKKEEEPAPEPVPVPSAPIAPIAPAPTTIQTSALIEPSISEIPATYKTIDISGIKKEPIAQIRVSQQIIDLFTLTLNNLNQILDATNNVVQKMDALSTNLEKIQGQAVPKTLGSSYISLIKNKFIPFLKMWNPKIYTLQSNLTARSVFEKTLALITQLNTQQFGYKSMLFDEATNQDIQNILEQINEKIEEQIPSEIPNTVRSFERLSVTENPQLDDFTGPVAQLRLAVENPKSSTILPTIKEDFKKLFSELIIPQTNDWLKLYLNTNIKEKEAKDISHDIHEAFALFSDISVILTNPQIAALVSAQVINEFYKQKAIIDFIISKNLTSAQLKEYLSKANINREGNFIAEGQVQLVAQDPAAKRLNVFAQKMDALTKQIEAIFKQTNFRSQRDLTLLLIRFLPILENLLGELYNPNAIQFFAIPNTETSNRVINNIINNLFGPLIQWFSYYKDSLRSTNEPEAAFISINQQLDLAERNLYLAILVASRLNSIAPNGILENNINLLVLWYYVIKMLESYKSYDSLTTAIKNQNIIGHNREPNPTASPSPFVLPVISKIEVDNYVSSSIDPRSKAISKAMQQSELSTTLRDNIAQLGNNLVTLKGMSFLSNADLSKNLKLFLINGLFPYLINWLSNYQATHKPININEVKQQISLGIDAINGALSIAAIITGYLLDTTQKNKLREQILELNNQKKLLTNLERQAYKLQLPTRDSKNLAQEQARYLEEFNNFIDDLKAAATKTKPLQPSKIPYKEIPKPRYS